MGVVTLIAACDANGCIGKDNKLPWKCKSEMDYFKKRVSSGSIIMGKNTCLSIKGRTFNEDPHYVLTTDKDFYREGFITVNSMDDMVTIMRANPEPKYLVLGGAQIYSQFIDLIEKDIDWSIIVELSIMNIVVEDGVSFFPLDKIKPDKGYMRTRIQRKLSEDIKWGVQTFYKIR